MKLPRPVGVGVGRILVIAAMIYWRTPPALRPFLPYLAGGLFWGGVIFALSCLGGCHAAPAVYVHVPSAATVQQQIGAPAAAARTSNARAVQLATKAEKYGLAAGSADARTLFSDRRNRRASRRRARR